MVSISLVINSGIITKSKVAVDKYSEEEMKEELKMAALACYMNGSYENVQNYLKNGTVEDLDGDTFKYCTSNNNYLVQMENGEVSLRESTGIKAIDYVEVGDFVNYNAGEWTETKGNPAGLEFGNYTAGNNRGQSVVDNTQSGWRVLYKNEDGSIVIIHAGVSEKFNMLYTTTYGTLRNNGTRILTGNDMSGIIDEYNHTPRDWSNYINKKYAKEAHCLKWSDIRDVSTDNDLRKIGLMYYCIYNNKAYYILSNGNYLGSNDYGPFGVRVVITLRKGIELKSIQKETDMFGNEAWILN